jgi:hypothetical protein
MRSGPVSALVGTLGPELVPCICSASIRLSNAGFLPFTMLESSIGRRS